MPTIVSSKGQSNIDAIKRYFCSEYACKMCIRDRPPTHPAKSPYSLFKQASDTVRSGVIIGLGSRLQVFQSELIKKITTRDEMCIRDRAL